MATGYVFDEIYTKHNFPGHPENAQRLFAIMAYLADNHILPNLTLVPARPATREELRRCHHPRHLPPPS